MKPKTMALSGAASLVAWGYLFLYLNINLGPVDILPNWLGYGMMLRALPALGSAVPAAALLRPLASMLAGWQGLLWVLPILGIPTATVHTRLARGRARLKTLLGGMEYEQSV